jgi:hypothetical protein
MHRRRARSFIRYNKYQLGHFRRPTAALPYQASSSIPCARPLRTPSSWGRIPPPLFPVHRPYLARSAGTDPLAAALGRSSGAIQRPLGCCKNMPSGRAATAAAHAPVRQLSDAVMSDAPRSCSPPTALLLAADRVYHPRAHIIVPRRVRAPAERAACANSHAGAPRAVACAQLRCACASLALRTRGDEAGRRASDAVCDMDRVAGAACIPSLRAISPSVD